MELSLSATMPVLIQQIMSMFLMMAIGFLVFKLGYLSKEGTAQLVNVAVYVANPAVIIQALATTFDMEKLVGALFCAVLSFSLTLVGAGIAHLVYKDHRRVAQVGIAVSNMGFLGIPLVKNVLGDEYVFYLSACMAAQVFVIWTYGVWTISQDKGKISAKKIFTNPVVLSVFVGAFLFANSIELTGVVATTAETLGGLNTGLAMLVLGCYLAQADLRGLLRTWAMYKASFLRLIVVPAISLLVLMPLPLEAGIKMTVLIAIATPVGTTCAIFAQMFGKDYRFGAGLVSLSTLFSIVTLPVTLAIGLMIF